MTNRAKISAYILAKNEAERIGDAIKSLSWADETIVIDTGSQDNTIELAKSLSAKVIAIPFKGFGQTRNEAITTCQNDWVLCLDADERCSPELRDEIIRLLEQDNLATHIYLAPRKNFFLNRWIKYSGWYPDYRHPVLFRKDKMRYTNDAVHESFISNEQPSYLKGQIIHYPYRDLTLLLEKANLYSTLGTKRLNDKNKKPSLINALFHASWAFLRQYILRRGFLDGWPGYILALNNFHATFFRYAKHWESARKPTQESL